MCNSSACADDLTVDSKTEHDAQVLTSESADFANLERYELLALKSEALKVSPVMKTNPDTEFYELEMDGTKIPNVSTTTHLGVKRQQQSQKLLKKMFGSIFRRRESQFTVYCQLDCTVRMA